MPALRERLMPESGIPFQAVSPGCGRERAIRSSGWGPVEIRHELKRENRRVARVSPKDRPNCR